MKNEEKKTTTEIEERKTIKNRIWVNPRMDSEFACEDEDGSYNFKFEIPGAMKDKIHLHVVSEVLNLVAPKDEDTEYVSHYHFGCPVDVPGIKAKYEDGVLDVELPYNCPNPFKGVDPVKIE